MRWIDSLSRSSTRLSPRPQTRDYPRYKNGHGRPSRIRQGVQGVPEAEGPCYPVESTSCEDNETVELGTIEAHSPTTPTPDLLHPKNGRARSGSHTRPGSVP